MSKRHIYIIDDSKTILKLAEGVLIGSYKVSLFTSGVTALEQMRKDLPDLVLLDIQMPNMDGYEVLKRMHENDKLKHIPVIFLTADSSNESEFLGLELGAMDYITKPFSPLVMQKRIERILELENLHKHLQQMVDSATDEIQKIFIQTITTITYAVDAKDRYTKGHSVRVAQYCLAIAKHLNWSYQDCFNLYYIALLHDIGKIGIPDSILNKPVKLTDEEYRLIRNHPIVGANILKPITMVPQISDGAKYHHERYDGKGYPYGLKGDEIPYIARIIGIADAYDAITSNRIYGKAQKKDFAIEELRKGKGTQFDPYLTGIMIDILEKGFTPSNSFNFEFDNVEKNDVETDSFIVEVCKKSELNANQAIDIDYLTGFPNRETFENLVNHYLSNPLNKGTLFLMDIDNFLYVNENYGHIAGDRILLKLADVIRSQADKNACFSRISGDKFAIFYQEEQTEQWMNQKGVDIIRAFQTSIRDIDFNHQLSVSIGITYTQKSKELCRDLIQQCDKALYYIKQNKKGQCQIVTYDNYSFAKSQHKGFQLDMAQLKNCLTEKEPVAGAYSVDYGNFEKIYQLIARSLTRNKKPSQILLFSITENLNGNMEISDLNEAMNILEQCIVGSLRKGDVTTRYSSSQQVVIMLDSDSENGNTIAERIISNYTKMYDNYNVDLIYNIDQIY